jgi:plastocyanin
VKKHVKEIFAAAVLIPVLIGMPYAVFQNAPWVQKDDIRVIYLTAVTRDGLWTDETVNAANYWTKTFRPATLQLQVNEKVLLRLTSMDVTHTFYVPELNIGPVEVDAGYTEEVLVQADKAGTYLYYCIIVCGECHYYMQGKVYVMNGNETVLLQEDLPAEFCENHNITPEYANVVEHGQVLYEQKGCITCHGKNGKGGIYNPNYVNKNVPELNTLADKMKIYWKEDAEILIQLFESQTDLETLEDDPPVDNFSRFLAQYNSMRSKIMDGSPELQRLNPDDPHPPLLMPSWEQKLSSHEIDAILAYLIAQYDWEQFD